MVSPSVRRLMVRRGNACGFPIVETLRSTLPIEVPAGHVTGGGALKAD